MDESTIRKLVEAAIERLAPQLSPASCTGIPLEVSARHVHLTHEAVVTLFGQGAVLNKVRDLSQPGEFLSDKRVKLVTQKGQIDNVAVLGPERANVQTELSATDCRTLGLTAPVNLSGDLKGAADVLMLAERGMLNAKGSVIIARAHIHMTPADALCYGVQNGQSVRVAIRSARPVILGDVIVRVSEKFALAMHIDFDEANACLCDSSTPVEIIR
jgi:propanediol utilization protein